VGTFPHHLTSSRNLWYDPKRQTASASAASGSASQTGAKSPDRTRLPLCRSKLSKVDNIFSAATFAPAPTSPAAEESLVATAATTTPDMKYFLQRRIDLVKAMYAALRTQRPTPSADENASAQSWQRLDLAPFANRALVKEGGSWIGIPNPYIEPGKHRFFGVPFQVLNQDQNHRRCRGGSGLQSCAVRCRWQTVAHRSCGSRRAKSAWCYVLHGAGYVADNIKAAQYSLVYADGSRTSVDIRNVGPGTGQKDPDDALARTSNLQDWWSTFPHFRERINAPRHAAQ
jgi:hypothetical protein